MLPSTTRPGHPNNIRCPASTSVTIDFRHFPPFRKTRIQRRERSTFPHLQSNTPQNASSLYHKLINKIKKSLSTEKPFFLRIIQPLFHLLFPHQTGNRFGNFGPLIFSAGFTSITFFLQGNGKNAFILLNLLLLTGKRHLIPLWHRSPSDPLISATTHSLVTSLVVTEKNPSLFLSKPQNS